GGNHLRRQIWDPPGEDPAVGVRMRCPDAHGLGDDDDLGAVRACDGDEGPYVSLEDRNARLRETILSGSHIRRIALRRRSRLPAGGSTKALEQHASLVE